MQCSVHSKYQLRDSSYQTRRQHVGHSLRPFPPANPKDSLIPASFRRISPQRLGPQFRLQPRNPGSMAVSSRLFVGLPSRSPVQIGHRCPIPTIDHCVFLFPHPLPSPLKPPSHRCPSRHPPTWPLRHGRATEPQIRLSPDQTQPPESLAAARSSQEHWSASPATHPIDVNHDPAKAKEARIAG